MAKIYGIEDFRAALRHCETARAIARKAGGPKANIRILPRYLAVMERALEAVIQTDEIAKPKVS